VNIFLSVISGLLLAASFPKLSLWPLAWIALIFFYDALIGCKTRKEALNCGLFFGLAFFGCNLFWLTSLARFVGGWAWLAWGSLALFETLFILLFVLLSRVASRGSRVVLFPIFWVAIEWLRTLGPFGVTAGDVGYSQSQFLWLIQIASFAGVYGVSFLVVFFNAALAEVLIDRKRWAFLAVALVMVAASCRYGYLIVNSPLSVTLPKLALIQPNVDQFDKMNSLMVEPVYDIHEGLTRQAATAEPEIIIWPETSVFTYLLRDPVFLPRVKKLAQETDAWLLIGTPHYDDQGHVYNSLVAVSPTGEAALVYSKEHLVPFGEYLPLKAWLLPILKGTGYFGSTFDADPDPRPVAAGDYQIAAAICFESTFPDLIKKRVGPDTDFILTVTNDGWFDDSASPYQHFEAGIFRAIENRKYFVQAGNTGFSGVIDPYGRDLVKSKLNQRGVILSE
jgi:apolipoprotein N-acyltransferase